MRTLAFIASCGLMVTIFFTRSCDAQCNVTTLPDGVSSSNCVENDRIPEGDSCAASCTEGYYIANSSKSTCQSDTTWDPTWDSICEHITCSGLPTIADGSVEDCKAGDLYGTTCTLKCNPGFYNDGAKTANCEETNSSDHTTNDGQWKGTAMCRELTCPSVPTVNHGTVEDCTDGTEYDSTCMLNCEKGYYSGGDRTTTCVNSNTSGDGMNDGVWNGTLLCETYMIITTQNNTQIAGVKYQNVTFTVKVESRTNNVNIVVYLVSTPTSEDIFIQLDGPSSSDGFLTFEYVKTNLSEADGGIYTFISNSSSENVGLYPDISEYLYQSVYVQVVPEDLTLTPGGDVFNYTRGSTSNTIVCEAYAEPAAKYRWERESGADEEGEISPDNNILQLEDAYFSDNGSFICYSSNNVSMASDQHPNVSIYIEVQGVPVIKANDNSYPPQDDIFLNCTMDANPLPTVMWRSNGTDYLPSDVFVSYDPTTSPSGAYYMYGNQLSLTSQLCMGRQEVKCSPSNEIGPSQKDQVFMINDGDYDLHVEKYYTFPVTGTSFSDAQQKCESASGHLVYIENQDLQDYLNGMTSEKFYIGAVKNGEDWTWGDNGPPLTYENFTDESADGDCVVSSASGWKTVNCSDSYNYVCELNASGIPQNLNVDTDQCDGTKLKVSWTPADDNYAKTQHRVLITAINGSNVGVLENTATKESQIELSNAEPDTQYTVQVFAAVDRCIKFLPSVNTFDTTGFGRPKQLIDPSINQVEGTQKCKVTWEYDETFRWQIESYIVTITTSLVENADDTPESTFTYTEKSSSYEFSMSPNSRYSVSIAAISCGGIGDDKVATGVCAREVSVPPEVNYTKPDVTKEEDGTVHISNSDGIPVNVSAQNQRNGPVSCVWVVATYDDNKEESDNRDSNITLDKFNAISNGSSHQEYFAYVSKNASDAFTIKLGVGEQSTHCNPGGANAPSSKRKKREIANVEANNRELQKGNFYRYYIVTTTPSGDTFLALESPISDIWQTNTEQYAWIAGVVVPVCVVVAVAIACYFRKCRRKSNPENELKMENQTSVDYDYVEYSTERNEAQAQEESTVNTATPEYVNVNLYETINPDEVGPKFCPIKVADLETVFKRKHSDNDEQFREEFEELVDKAETIECKFSTAREMRTLNRLDTVLPANDATVPLGNGQYINASYIDAYQQPKKFIATEAPKPNTVNHFWSIIWEQEVKSIVVLASEDDFRLKKCEKYWPDKDEKLKFGHYTVKGGETYTMGLIVRRTFSIYPATMEGKASTVTQFHFTSWQEQSVPLKTASLFNLRRIMRKEYGAGAKPIIVHGITGSGRTGTFISLDYLMEEMKNKDVIDVRWQIWRLRQNRTEMVQNLEQYVLLHKMLFEASLMKNCDLDTADFAEKLGKKGLQGTVELNREFQLLERIPPLLSRRSIGTQPENLEKNHDTRVIAYDHNLATIRKIRPKETGTLYINASRVHGYESTEEYIVTQDPMPGAEELIWRLALDNHVKCIVKIKKRSETQNVCAKYWPDEDAVEFGRITVSLIDKVAHGHHTMERKFIVKESVLASERSNTITQFEFNGWPESSEEEADAILGLIEQVQAFRRSDTTEAPVMIHCGDGSERTGAFCAVANMIGRVDRENRVDVLGTAKDLREERPNMIYSPDEYRLCHTALQSYLRKFEAYSNFIN